MRLFELLGAVFAEGLRLFDDAAGETGGEDRCDENHHIPIVKKTSKTEAATSTLRGTLNRLRGRGCDGERCSGK